MKKCQMIIKLEFAPGNCAICKSDDDELKSIEHNYVFNHSVENYGEMLLKCFSIKLVNSEDKTIGVEICGSCVISLRSAASFRQLVEAAEKTQQKKAPYLKNGKSPRKGVLNAKKKSHSKAKQKSQGTKESNKHKGKIAQLTKIIVDNNDCSRPEANHQIEVKLEPYPEELYDNWSNLSDQSLFEIREDSISVDKYDTFDDRDQVTDRESSTTSAQMSRQFEVKLEPSEIFNLSNLSDQSLSKVPEHSNSVDRYDIFDDGEQITDGESSTTSAQMRIATGYKREVERSKKKETFIIPPLNKSCKMCPICSQKFQERHSLSVHYDNHFPAFVCEICGASYSKVRSYYNHRNMHLGNRHACPLCSKTFATTSSKLSHIRVHHNKIKPMGCSECDARFHSSELRRRHMASKHGKECTMFQCPICKITFYSSFKLNIHIKRHDNIKSCFCTICDKGFFGKQELRQHMVMHTDAGKYKCSECGKGFPRLISLTKHLKSHNNIKDYVCALCNRAFVQKSTLKTHMKVHAKISS